MLFFFQFRRGFGSSGGFGLGFRGFGYGFFRGFFCVFLFDFLTRGIFCGEFRAASASGFLARDGVGGNLVQAKVGGVTHFCDFSGGIADFDCLALAGKVERRLTVSPGSGADNERGNADKGLHNSPEHRIHILP